MRAARFLAIVLLLAAIIAAGLYLLRLPIAGWAVRSGMAGAGLENPQARVTALTFDGARLEGVAAGGSEGLRIEAVEADFRLGRLWSERKIDAVRIRGGRLGVIIDETGGVSFAGMKLGGGGDGGGSGLPFDRLSVEDVALAISTPDGAAEGAIDAEYDVATGGAASLDLSAERFTWNTARLTRVKSNADITFSADGSAALAGNFSGDIESGGVRARDVAVTLTGEGGSWRDAADGAIAKINGEARIDFAAPVIEIASLEPQYEAGAEPLTILGEPVREASLSGALTIGFSDAGVIVRFAEAQTPLALTTPVGSALTLSPQGDAPLYARTSERETASFGFALNSEGVGISGSAGIEQSGGVWRVAAPFVIDAFDNGDFSFGGTLLDVNATVQGKVVGVDAAIESDIRKATIGRLTITDAPLAGAFRIDADMEAKSATVASADQCVRTERMRGRLADQDIELSLAGVRLCAAGKPLAVIDWSGDATVALSGELAAEQGSFRLGETNAAGRPSSIRFDGAYNQALNSTTLFGEISGGAMTLNEALELSDAAGDFNFALDAEGMRATASLDRLRIAQHVAVEGALPFFSPVAAAGEAALAGDDMRFSYVLTTPEGYLIGDGAGAHDMASASGETVLSMNGTQFRPEGLQPNRLSPFLKGIVDAAEGSLDGSVRFGWSKDGVASGADFHFKNISFGGPTRAVTRTTGFNGDVELTSLFPLTTDGTQTVTVDGVDLDALQLEAGAISFELPGDETVHLVSAEFPWFGGALGVYEATASFAGEAMIPLRAQNIDLKQVLDYVKVEGLSGEGVMTGSLPLVFRDGRAFIEGGVFESVGSGVIRYVGAATEQAASTGGGAKIAFDFLKDLRYRSMKVTVNGPLDGRLAFDMEFVGTGEMVLQQQGLSPGGQGRVPVLYKITLDAALIELLQQALLSTDVRLQIQQSVSGGDGAETPSEPEP